MKKSLQFPFSLVEEGVPLYALENDISCVGL